MSFLHFLTTIAAIVFSAEALENISSESKTIFSMISLADTINLGLLVLTLLGLFFTGFQLMQTKKINRSSLVKEMYFNLYNDEELREIFYMIEWDDSEISRVLNLGGTEEERKVDKLLSFFDIICNMYYRGVLGKKDMKVFSYEMMRVYGHSAVAEYLKFLKNWQDEQKLGESYVYFKKFCGSYMNKKNNC